MPNRHDETADGAAGALEQHPPVVLDVPNDPDGDDSVPGSNEDTEQDPLDGEVGPVGNPVKVPEPLNVSRAGRTRTQTLRFVESQQQRAAGIVAYVAAHEAIDPLLYQEDLEMVQFEVDPIAFALKATSDPDTMYYHEAMKEPDAHKFCTAMTKEVDDQTNKQHWEIVRRDQLPVGVKVLPAVWSMKRKCRIATQEMYKWKARLNVGGHTQKYGVHYWEYVFPGRPLDHHLSLPGPGLRVRLVHAPTRFCSSLPPGKVSTEYVYIDVPQGVEFNGRSKDFCLHVLQNIYGGKDAGRTW
jgi:hypothetical protein